MTSTVGFLPCETARPASGAAAQQAVKHEPGVRSVKVECLEGLNATGAAHGNMHAPPLLPVPQRGSPEEHVQSISGKHYTPKAVLTVSFQVNQAESRGPIRGLLVAFAVTFEGQSETLVDFVLAVKSWKSTFVNRKRTNETMHCTRLSTAEVFLCEGRIRVQVQNTANQQVILTPCANPIADGTARNAHLCVAPFSLATGRAMGVEGEDRVVVSVLAEGTLLKTVPSQMTLYPPWNSRLMATVHVGQGDTSAVHVFPFDQGVSQDRPLSPRLEGEGHVHGGRGLGKETPHMARQNAPPARSAKRSRGKKGDGASRTAKRGRVDAPAAPAASVLTENMLRALEAVDVEQKQEEEHTAQRTRLEQVLAESDTGMPAELAVLELHEKLAQEQHSLQRMLRQKSTVEREQWVLDRLYDEEEEEEARHQVCLEHAPFRRSLLGYHASCSDQERLLCAEIQTLVWLVGQVMLLTQQMQGPVATAARDTP
jgi:hypothetical protein